MGVLGDLGLGSIVPESAGGIGLGIISVVGKYMLYTFAIIVPLVYIYFWWWKYPVEITIASKKGGISAVGKTDSLSVKFIADYGRLVDTDSGRKIFLAKRKLELPVEGKNIYANAGLFRKWRIFLLEDDAGDLHPINLAQLQDLTTILRPEQMLHKGWAWERKKKADMDWQTTPGIFAKYGHIIFPMMYMMVFFVLTIILVFQIKDVASALQSVASALSSIGAPVAPVAG